MILSWVTTVWLLPLHAWLQFCPQLEQQYSLESELERWLAPRLVKKRNMPFDYGRYGFRDRL